MTTDDQGGELRRALDENRRLRAEIDRLRADNEHLRGRLNDLEAKLEAALRAGKRQSAPFSRGEPKADPKRPGRKSGEKHGRHGHRQPPEHVDETVAVDVPCGCPDCGGELEEAGIEEQWQEEILPPRPIRRRFVVQVGRCRRRVRGRHPLQTSSASGAAAAQVGPEALSVAARLHYELGLSMGKTAAVLHEVCGIRITRGGVAQALARLGERCGPTHGALTSCVRRGLLVVMDESGWRVGGIRAWLWVAAAELVTVYAIRRGRGFEQAAELIGKDYAGLLVRDGWGPYGKFEEAVHQTCVAHLLRRCREMLEVGAGAGRSRERSRRSSITPLTCATGATPARSPSRTSRSSWTSWSNSFELYWHVRSAAPTAPRAGSFVISIASSTPSSPSCDCQRCRPPTGWPSRRSARRSSTARSGVATGPGTAPAIRSA